MRPCSCSSGGSSSSACSTWRCSTCAPMRCRTPPIGSTVELGQRLFAHLLRLPVAYFETRSTGQTVARVRELETIRNFLTGQGLFSAIDLVFAVVFIAVLFAYSWPLTLIVLAGVPFYLLIGFSVRPPLRELISEKFNRGAASQQFLVETIVGVNTVKSAAVEPIMRAQWEEKLAAYVKTSFSA